MNKTELIDIIADDAKLSKKDAGEALDAFIQAVKVALSKGDAVTLIGFGTFDVSERQARKGRNPRTGEELDIPAAKIPKFRPGKALRDAVQPPKTIAKAPAAKAKAPSKAKAKASV